MAPQSVPEPVAQTRGYQGAERKRFQVNEFHRWRRRDILIEDRHHGTPFDFQPRFHGRVTGGQHQDGVAADGPSARHLAGMIARRLFFFERRILLSVDPDQSQVTKRSEYRQPSPDKDVAGP